MTGIPPEQARDRDPAYFRELDSLPNPEAPIPEAPKGAHICWSCRVLAHQSAGEYGESARAFYARAGEPVTHLLLARGSYHYCGYDSNGCGYTYVARPGDRDPHTSYLDRRVTHVALRPDVRVRTNDAYGASTTWDPKFGCPFVRLHEEAQP